MKQYKIDARVEFARIRAYTLMAIFNPCGFTLFRVEKFNERRQRAYKNVKRNRREKKKKILKTIYQKNSALNEREKNIREKSAPTT